MRTRYLKDEIRRGICFSVLTCGLLAFATPGFAQSAGAGADVGGASAAAGADVGGGGASATRPHQPEFRR